MNFAQHGHPRMAWKVSGKPNHLEGEGFSPIIELISEGNGQIDLPKWHGLFPRHDAMERCLG